MRDWELTLGDCLQVLLGMADGSVDALVTDPPAGIGFMGKEWDDFRRARNPADVGRKDVFGRTSAKGPEYARCGRAAFLAFLTPVMAECLRVLKPGGYGLVWALPRTSHWTATALEDAGFEIRDVVVHITGQGFPKGKGCLKPAAEHWVLCRRPGPRVLPLNIDECRVPCGERPNILSEPKAGRFSGVFSEGSAANGVTTAGRYPANLVLSHHPSCVCRGTRRVRGSNPPGPNPAGLRNGYRGGADNPPPAQNYAGPDGREEVEDWVCHPGFSGLVPAFALGNDVCSLADEPERLLGQLQVLLEALRKRNKSDSIPLRCASGFYRIDSRQPSGALADEVARALGASSFLGSMPGYPPSRGFCGELLRPVLEARRSGLPSLRDALARACSALRSPGRSPPSPGPGRPASWGDSPPPGLPPGSQPSTGIEAPPCEEPGGGTASHNGHRDDQESPPVAQGGSTPASSNGECGSRETSPCTADIAAAVRLLWALVADLAWRFVLPAEMIRRCDIDINVGPCPVFLLDVQAGELHTHAGKYRNDGAVGMYGPSRPSGTVTSEGNSGGASRFFYCSKASRADRGEGNDHPTTKPTALMAWLCKLVARPGETVLDPFAGSASTGVACLRSGRRFIGIERDPHYFEIALKRLAGVDGPLFAAAPAPEKE